MKRVSDRQVALYIEEHEPSLEAELLSAVELGGAGAARPAPPGRLVDSLVERAVASAQTLEWGASIDRPLLRRFSALAAGSALAGIAAILLSPAFLQHGALVLFAPWKSDALPSPYGIEVLPGSVTVARGSDLEVRAQLSGFDSEAVELAVKRGEGNWERWPMPADGEPGEKLFMLLDLQEASEYFVQAGGVRSTLYRIDVADLPYVEKIDLEYRFPAYTGMSPQRVEDGGDIAALRGTEVRVEVTSTVPVTTGRLLIEGKEGSEPQPIALAVEEGGRLAASIPVERDTFYRVELPGPGGDWVTASPDYAIEVMVDQPPVLSFTKPGRDTRAHKLEEVFTEAHVEDDYGVARLDLVYSLNGGEEKTITLLGGNQRPKQFDGGHTFYLEELDLVDGDFISYFARATEAGPSGRAATVTSDIYFVEITPFSKNYRQAEQGGGGMQGGQMDNALSLRQRQIVAATFKLIRDKKDFEAKQYDENLTTVGLMQGRLREQVETLIARMQNRLRGEDGVPEDRRGPDGRDGRDEAGGREPEREEAAGSAAARAARAGSPAARRGPLPRRAGRLPGRRHAGRAAADGRGPRRPVRARARQAAQPVRDGRARRAPGDAGGGRRGAAAARGAGAPAGAGERAPAQAARADGHVGRRRAEPAPAHRADRRAGAQARAARARALASRSGADRAAAAAGRRLDAARQRQPVVRRDRAGHRGSRATARGAPAARAQQGVPDVVRDGRPQPSRRAGAAHAGAHHPGSGRARVAGHEGSAGNGGEQTRGGGRSAETEEKISKLLGEKDQLEKEVGALESQIDRVARQARGAEKDAARSLSEAADSIRENQVKEKIRYSKGVVRGRSPEYAKKFEEEIGRDLEEMAESLGEAKRSLGGSQEDKAEQALQGARDLVRRLESFENGLEDRGAQRQAEKLGRSGRAG